jgi:hypothetical protein
MKKSAKVRTVNSARVKKAFDEAFRAVREEATNN